MSVAKAVESVFVLNFLKLSKDVSSRHLRTESNRLLSNSTFFFLFFFCFLEIYVQQVVYVLRRTGSGKLPLDVIMSI